MVTTGAAICPLVRDVADAAISSIYVRVIPGAFPVTCAVASFAPFGYIYRGAAVNAQTINMNALGDLTQFLNGSYIAYCQSASRFQIYSVKWAEP